MTFFIWDCCCGLYSCNEDCCCTSASCCSCCRGCMGHISSCFLTCCGLCNLLCGFCSGYDSSIGMHTGITFETWLGETFEGLGFPRTVTFKEVCCDLGSMWIVIQKIYWFLIISTSMSTEFQMFPPNYNRTIQFYSNLVL